MYRVQIIDTRYKFPTYINFDCKDMTLAIEILNEELRGTKGLIGVIMKNNMVIRCDNTINKEE